VIPLLYLGAGAAALIALAIAAGGAEEPEDENGGAPEPPSADWEPRHGTIVDPFGETRQWSTDYSTASYSPTRPIAWGWWAEDWSEGGRVHDAGYSTEAEAVAALLEWLAEPTGGGSGGGLDAWSNFTESK